MAVVLGSNMLCDFVQVLGIELPDYWMSWVNLKSAFATEYGVEQRVEAASI